MIEIDKFIVTDNYVYGLTGEENENYEGRYFVYDLVNNKVKTFEHEKEFNNYLTTTNLDTKADYKDFNYYYIRHWNGWRFWLLA